MKNMKFFARRGIFGDRIELFAFMRAEAGRITAQPTTFLAVNEQEAMLEPAPWIDISADSAQRLMDELWHVGLRPSEGSGSAGSLAATERHLADMRALVFEKMALTKPAEFKPPTL